MLGRKKSLDGQTALRRGARWLEVQGTFAYPDAAKRAKGNYNHGTAIGVLVPVTDGQYKGAVSVYLDGAQVGSLPAMASPEFYPIVLELTKKRKKATVLLDLALGPDHRDIDISICADPIVP
jgi:hypothetical protein